MYLYTCIQYTVYYDMVYHILYDKQLYYIGGDFFVARFFLQPWR